ncbi:MAG: hypothetical protein KF819_29710 [Labilithrix sp.]|nr:hypothetical protein [Labilithrix sp.]
MPTELRCSIWDAAHDGSSFALDVSRGEAFVFGRNGNVVLDAVGTLPGHFVLLRHEGTVLAASASDTQPASVYHAGRWEPLPCDWTALPLPCRLRAGGATIALAVAPPSVAPRLEVAPPPGPPAVEASALRSAAIKLRDDYRRLPRTRRVLCLLGVVFAALATAHAAGATESEGAPPHAAPIAPSPSPVAVAIEAVEAAPAAAAAPAPAIASSGDDRLGVSRRVALDREQRKSYQRALRAILAGDLEKADALLEPLAQVSPDDPDLLVLRRVLAAKMRPR